MRKSVLLWLLLSAFCGTALFHTSQKVHDERGDIAALEKSIAEEEESIRVLSAEWGYLNQPQRLEKLAKEHLTLVPMTGRRFARLEDIPLRGEKPAENIAATPDMAKEEPTEKAEAAAPKKQPPPDVKIVNSPPVKVPAVVPPSQKPEAKTPAAASSRRFGDVIKSLETGQ